MPDDGIRTQRDLRPVASAMDAETRCQTLHTAFVGKMGPRRVFRPRVLLVGWIECRKLPF